MINALQYNTDFVGIERLIKQAKKRIPAFAFEYLDGGCNEDVNLARNTRAIRSVCLRPQYLRPFDGYTLKCKLFGTEYNAPFGISPIGLQGLIWPNSCEILAKAAANARIPFILSTVSTASIERIAEITHGSAWFQLYNPAEERIRKDLLNRLEASGYPVLVLLCDVPAFGFRPRDIRNGLSMPPKMTLRNIAEVVKHPHWALASIRYGIPTFATLKPYMGSNLSMKQLGRFMNQTFSGRLNEDLIGRIREQWKGKLILKGMDNAADAEIALRLGIDGIIVSNHGGRQLDAARASIESLLEVLHVSKGKMTTMIDSGLRSGVDIARCMASGADFTFLGRTFMYAVAALGEKGGMHAVAMLQAQLEQIMQQLGAARITDLPDHLVDD
jgi:L-lactate dehydrogenase (cytochrome)